MQLLIAIVISLLAGLSTVLGGLVIFFHFKSHNIDKFITLSLAFSLAIMIGISISDLIPESTYVLLSNYGVGKGIIYSLVAFLSGAIIIFLIQKHIHKIELKKSDLYKLGILNMIALILHNFPEGVATFMSSYKDVSLGLKLSLAIALHNIPEGISIAVPIYYATKSKSQALIKTFLSGIAEVAGALIAFLFLKNYITNEFISLVLILVGGIMITLAIEGILPKAKEYRLPFYLYLGMGLGFLLIIFNVIVF